MLCGYKRADLFIKSLETHTTVIYHLAKDNKNVSFWSMQKSFGEEFCSLLQIWEYKKTPTLLWLFTQQNSNKREHFCLGPFRACVTLEDLCCSNLLWATQSWHGQTLGMSVGLFSCHGVMGYFPSLWVRLTSRFSHLTPRSALALHCVIP